MKKVLPTDELEAEHYGLTKAMIRPPIYFFHIGLYAFMFLYSVIGIAFGLFCLSRFGLVIFSNKLLDMMNDKPGLFGVILITISFFMVLAVFSKRILIGLVHIYQRNAPESRRRMCLFKPTCSEYAILALNKYGSVRGTLKTINRFRRCKGSKYRIDYP